ncbi:MAG: GNAT family N-acetyltransferase [Chitinophagales bacterium]
MKEEIKILDYLPEHQPFFEHLFKNWFEPQFGMELEPLDKFLLTDPQKAILQGGGSILIGLVNNQPAGTVALRKLDDFEYELIKMIVDEKFRGLGLGKALIEAAIQSARNSGAKRLVLYSHSSLQAAIHLYQKFGFVQIPLEQGTYHPSRCDTKMGFEFDKITVICAGREYASLISSIGRQSFEEAFASHFNKKEDLQNYLDHTYDPLHIEASISKQNNVFFLALLNGEAIGFIKLKKQSLNIHAEHSRQMELQKIYVLRKFHGRGVADELMRKALLMAIEIGTTLIWLDVMIGNERAFRFYIKNGFSRIGHHEFRIGSQVFKYHVMAKRVENLLAQFPSNEKELRQKYQA